MKTKTKAKKEKEKENRRAGRFRGLPDPSGVWEGVRGGTAQTQTARVNSEKYPKRKIFKISGFCADGVLISVLALVYNEKTQRAFRLPANTGPYF